MCVFCEIVSGDNPAEVVFEDDTCLVFLDIRPLFPGHCLVIPRMHVETLGELPAASTAPLFGCVQMVSRVLPDALGAHGTFVAINNKVSQSVAHLHVHVVPRRFKDGLKGFFWPRRGYEDAAHMQRVAEAIRMTLGAAAETR